MVTAKVASRFPYSLLPPLAPLPQHYHRAAETVGGFETTDVKIISRQLSRANSIRTRGLDAKSDVETYLLCDAGQDA